MSSVNAETATNPSQIKITDSKPEIKLNRAQRRRLRRMQRPYKKAQAAENAVFPRYTNENFKFIGPKK